MINADRSPIGPHIPSRNTALEPSFETEKEEDTHLPKIRFLSPSECSDYQIPEGHLLIGNQHIVRGEIFVIGGTQGVGKSRAVTYLAACGATGDD